jgi:hypothetical protein
MKKITKIISLLFLLQFPLSVMAHNLAPALLKITMASDDSAHILWKTTNKQIAGVNVMPVLPGHCRKVSDQNITLEGRAVIYQWPIKCQATLVGQAIHFTDLDRAGTNVMVVFTDAQGRQESRLIHNKNPVFIIPASLTMLDTIKEYVASGIEHLLFGWDHVLFVVGLLVLLYKNIRVLVIAITSFTVGHSFSLVIASLGFLSFNARLIEVFIALTLIIMALEILNMHKTALPWSMRNKPFILTFAFGLIHGCGFASVLADALSMEGQLLIPLIAFNAGIETGQLMIIAGSFIVVKLLMAIGLHCQSRTAATITGYLIGTLSSYWLFVRMFE